MYKKILKINIFVFVLIFTSILVAAQSDKDSIVKVPIKVVRELGSERRETVRSLSVVGVGYLRGADLSTRGIPVFIFSLFAWLLHAPALRAKPCPYRPLRLAVREAFSHKLKTPTAVP